GFMRTGSSESAPFGGSTLLSSVDDRASERILKSSGEIVAAGMIVLMPLTAPRLSEMIIATAPALAACSATSKLLAPKASLTRAIRPETLAGHVPVAFTKTYRWAKPVAGTAALPDSANNLSRVLLAAVGNELAGVTAPTRSRGRGHAGKFIPDRSQQ